MSPEHLAVERARREWRIEQNCIDLLRKAGAKKHKRGWYQQGKFLADTAHASWNVLNGGG